MKLLLGTLLLFSIALSSGNTNGNENEKRKVISHISFDAPAAFGFGKTLYIDVDRDGVNDFMFTTILVNKNDDIHTKYIVDALNNNEILSVDGSTAINEDGMAVAPYGNINWTNNATEIIEQVYTGTQEEWKGTWSGDRDQFIGIKLVREGISYHGWVKVSIDQIEETAFVEGYAVNRVPEGQINAGEK